MGKIVLYCPQGLSLDVLLALQNKARNAGIQAEECATGNTWDEVADTMQMGDELVVDTLSRFSSLNELLGLVSVRGIKVRSIDEPWFADSPIKDPQQYQKQLYELSSSLHAIRTKQGLGKAAAKGRKPGRKPGSNNTKTPKGTPTDVRVSQVDALREERPITLAEACQMIGISVNAYYRKRR